MKHIYFYSHFLNQVSELVMIADIDSKFIYANDFAAKLTGFKTSDHVLGLDPYQILCPAVECAQDFINQNKIVFKTRQKITVLDIHGYAKNERKILLTKKMPYVERNNVMGAICYTTSMHSKILSNACSLLIQADKKYFPNHKAYERSYIAISDSTTVQLTAREMDCVFYLLRGKTIKEIAKQVSLSPRTIEHRINNIKLKFNCHSRSDIIDYALQAGYLSYIPKQLLMQNISCVVD